MEDNSGYISAVAIAASTLKVARSLGSSVTVSFEGTLSGTVTIQADVDIYSGTITPDTAHGLAPGSLTLNSTTRFNGNLGSLVSIAINADSIPSTINVVWSAALSGTLQFDLDPNIAYSSAATA